MHDGYHKSDLSKFDSSKATEQVCIRDEVNYGAFDHFSHFLSWVSKSLIYQHIIVYFRIDCYEWCTSNLQFGVTVGSPSNPNFEQPTIFSFFRVGFPLIMARLRSCSSQKSGADSYTNAKPYELCQ